MFELDWDSHEVKEGLLLQGYLQIELIQMVNFVNDDCLFHSGYVSEYVNPLWIYLEWKI